MILWLLGLVYAAPMDFSGCRGDAAVAAVARFEDMISTGDPAVEVGFADCLARLGLLHSAQRHYLEVVRQGPGSEMFSQALGRAFALAEEIGDLRSLSGSALDSRLSGSARARCIALRARSTAGLGG